MLLNSEKVHITLYYNIKQEDIDLENYEYLASTHWQPNKLTIFLHTILE